MVKRSVRTVSSEGEERMKSGANLCEEKTTWRAKSCSVWLKKFEQRGGKKK